MSRAGAGPAVVTMVTGAVAALPLALPSTLAAPARLLLVATVLALAATAVALDRWRPAAATLLLVHLAASVLAADGGPVVAVAVLGGVLLRLWCGLPELADLARVDRGELLRDLLPELVGGAAAAGLVVAVADARAGLPPVVLVAAVAGAVVLVTAGLARVRD